MKLSDFDYSLPPNLIAQHPVEPRDAARLLVVDRSTGRLEHRVFRDLPEYLQPADVMVVNSTRVGPARLRARKPAGGAVEVLLLRPAREQERATARPFGSQPLATARPRDGQIWEVLLRPGRRVRIGTRLHLSPRLSGEVIAAQDEGIHLVAFAGDRPVLEAAREIGEMPVPPYIHEPLRRPEDYQTVYASAEGAVAAPTAGLHFTPELLDRIRAAGVRIITLTLHIGLGTFRPVVTTDVTSHRMDAEWYEVGEGAVRPGRGWSELFIYPGFRFKATDALITNFHLPNTTLLMLVCAFAGRELILRAYQEAIAQSYRFYSFGDAMLIL